MVVEALAGMMIAGSMANSPLVALKVSCQSENPKATLVELYKSKTQISYQLKITGSDHVMQGGASVDYEDEYTFTIGSPEQGFARLYLKPEGLNKNKKTTGYLLIGGEEIALQCVGK